MIDQTEIVIDIDRARQIIDALEEDRRDTMQFYQRRVGEYRRLLRKAEGFIKQLGTPEADKFIEKLRRTLILW